MSVNYKIQTSKTVAVNSTIPLLDDFGQLYVPGLESRLDSIVARRMKYSAAITLLETIIKRNADLFTEKDRATAESAIARKYSFSDKSIVRISF